MELKLFWTDFSQKELEKNYRYHREKAGTQIAKNLVNGIYNETLKLTANKTTENWTTRRASKG
ncbi:hypothetical protein [Arenibacter latericius]|uniref:hypothetical protein n=1 Tax=Arenibacter latericius TaxID=86104 RepID=UPI0003FE7C37|nr:hypothetical protein [Arenibacter latericius]